MLLFSPLRQRLNVRGPMDALCYLSRIGCCLCGALHITDLLPFTKVQPDLHPRQCGPTSMIRAWTKDSELFCPCFYIEDV